MHPTLVQIDFWIDFFFVIVFVSHNFSMKKNCFFLKFWKKMSSPSSSMTAKSFNRIRQYYPKAFMQCTTQVCFYNIWSCSMVDIFIIDFFFSFSSVYLYRLQHMHNVLNKMTFIISNKISVMNNFNN